MSEELKPCPFCGGEAVMRWFQDEDHPDILFICECEKNCGANTWTTEENAVAAWNRRPPHSDRDTECVSAQQINVLSDFIMRLDCGYPRADAEHPNGIGVVEAATMYIHELREKVFALQGAERELTNARKDLGQLNKYVHDLERDYRELAAKQKRLEIRTDNVTEERSE